MGRIENEVALRGFGFFTFGSNKNSAYFNLLLCHYFSHVAYRNWGICFIVGRPFLFPADRIPFPTILSEIFTSLASVDFGRQDFALSMYHYLSVMFKDAVSF